MEDLSAWLLKNWQFVLLVFYVVEKIVKLTPFKQDDILFDIIGGAIWKLVGKAPEEEG